MNRDHSYWIFLQWIDEQSVAKDGPAVFGHFGLLLGPDGKVTRVRLRFILTCHNGASTHSYTHTHTNIALCFKLCRTQSDLTYESTWFSKDRMRGYGEVLKALSAIASITSYSPKEQEHY